MNIKLLSVPAFILGVTMVNMDYAHAYAGQNNGNMPTQVNAVHMAQDDTTLFRPNTAAGWNTLAAAYLVTDNDSISFEVIFSRTMSATTDWLGEQFAGTVGSRFRPMAERVLNYIEWPRIWQIRVVPSGQVYFKLLNGQLPTGTTVVLPVKTKYKS